MTRTLLRPTAFVDSPFGHDGKVARLAGGMSWFSAVELIRIEGHCRVSVELVSVEYAESRFDDDMAAQWRAATPSRPSPQLRGGPTPPHPPQGVGSGNAPPRSSSHG